MLNWFLQKFFKKRNENLCKCAKNRVYANLKIRFYVVPKRHKSIEHIYVFLDGIKRKIIYQNIYKMVEVYWTSLKFKPKELEHLAKLKHLEFAYNRPWDRIRLSSKKKIHILFISLFNFIDDFDHQQQLYTHCVKGFLRVPDADKFFWEKQ